MVSVPWNQLGASDLLRSPFIVTVRAHLDFSSALCLGGTDILVMSPFKETRLEARLGHDVHLAFTLRNNPSLKEIRS